MHPFRTLVLLLRLLHLIRLRTRAALGEQLAGAGHPEMTHRPRIGTKLQTWLSAPLHSLPQPHPQQYVQLSSVQRAAPLTRRSVRRLRRPQRCDSSPRSSGADGPQLARLLTASTLAPTSPSSSVMSVPPAPPPSATASADVSRAGLPCAHPRTRRPPDQDERTSLSSHNPWPTGADGSSQATGLCLSDIHLYVSSLPRRALME